ncbi:MAG: hypothetical protein E7Z80_08865 [Methanobrevibacter thaueri]|nr:hypothetical protein [Methanobrevibacter thaueri]
MNKNQKILIIALIGVIIVLGGATISTFLKEPLKTVELFENGTTIEVTANTNLKSHDNFSTIYVTGKNTTIIGIDNNNLAGALVSKMLSSLIADTGEMQDNGLYKLDKNSIMELGDKLGQGYDDKNIKEAYVSIKHNTSINQSIIIIGVDEQEINNIINSIHWKQGKTTNTTNETNTETSPQPSHEKTYPFTADDGSIIGYYHVGDTVEYLDHIFKLKSDGTWEMIGESKGSSNDAYNQGYNDALDDSEDYDYDDDYETSQF